MRLVAGELTQDDVPLQLFLRQLGDDQVMLVGRRGDVEQNLLSFSGHKGVLTCTAIAIAQGKNFGVHVCVRVPPDPDQEVGCLIWCGGQSRGGQRSRNTVYGSFTINARLKGVRAHVAMATAAGKIRDFRVPPGFHLSHQCDRSLCVEETHVELQPAVKNIRDRHARPARPLSPEQEEVIRYRGMVPVKLGKEKE